MMTAVIVITTVAVLLVVGLGFLVVTNSGSRPRNHPDAPDHQQTGYSGASYGPDAGS
ncbi:hypothetical protein [Mycobacteroides chelonae]|uniref:hypothetical protein n=1 Tax=Mycobacteroides chelonae TaxID=1774 RepID=UPI001C2C5985|nr:hypothetical protein [Mycobacteroides chelonae]MBV0918817.1 hypothetical protein [Mycobacteroides chelonae]